jgi:hypothetical protein
LAAIPANWTEYSDALRRRGDITTWCPEEAIEQRHPVKLGAHGRPQLYADHAIETAILIRQVFLLPLRQTEGFMNSVARLMNAEISIPDFSPAAGAPVGSVGAQANALLHAA